MAKKNEPSQEIAIDDATSRYIIFSLNKEYIAVSLENIKEVIDIERIRSIPKVSQKYMGLYNLRGEVIPVINFYECLNLDYDPANSKRPTNLYKTIILNLSGELIGAVVEDIVDIVELQSKHFENVPDAIQTQIELKYFTGIAAVKNYVVKLINIKEVIADVLLFAAGMKAAPKPRVKSKRTSVSKVVKQKSSAPVKKKQTSKVKSKTEKEVFNKVEAQASFELSKADKQDLKIDEADLDAFRELGNMGAGNAGNALSQMLNKKVFLEIPPAKVMSMSELTKLYTKTETSVGFIGDIKGTFESLIFLMFTTDHIENLLQNVLESKTKKNLSKESDLSADEKSAVTELFSILTSHYISAMSDFLKLQMEPPEYRFYFKKTQNLFNSPELGKDRDIIKAIVIETSINVADSAPIKGKFVLLLHPQVVQRILKRIKELWQ